MKWLKSSDFVIERCNSERYNSPYFCLVCAYPFVSYHHKVTDEIVERVERGKEERFERDQAMRKLVKDSHKQRDKKNQEKLKQEVQ